MVERSERLVSLPASTCPSDSSMNLSSDADDSSLALNRLYNELSPEYVGYPLAAPSSAALAVGLVVAVMIMGIVTVQFFAFSRRFWQDRKAAVLVANMVFWCNIIGLILLGEPVYHCLITRFKGGSVDHFTITLTRRYMMMMIPNIMSRAILAYSVALHTACFFASGLLSKTLETLFHLVIAFRVVINAVVVRAVLDSMTEHNPQVKEGYPPLLKISTSLSIATECVLCALLCKAIFHASKNGEQNPVIRRMARYAIPSYIFTIAWHIGFSLAVWCRSSFLTAGFGVPLGAVSNISLLAVLHANPSVLGPPTWRQRSQVQKVLASTKISITNSVDTESCHDGPLEAQLAERLERFFPEGEESRTYYPEPDRLEPIGAREAATPQRTGC